MLTSDPARSDGPGSVSRRALLQISLVALASAPSAGASSEEGVFKDLPPVPGELPSLQQRECRSRDGTSIRYVKCGRGRITLVFLHGANCNWRFFAPQLGPLSKDYSIVALDYAGHGSSGRRVGTFSMAAFVDDVEAVVTDAARGPLIFVAHSTGGRIACAATGRLGSRLLGMVGIDTFHNLAAAPPSESVVQQRVARLRTDFVASMREYIKPFFLPGTSPALMAWVERQMLRTVPDDAAEAGGVFSAFDARDAVKGWPRRVVALNSDWVPLDYRTVRTLLPAFDLIVLAGRGHFPNLEDPGVFNPLLRVTVERIVRESGLT